MDCKQRKALWKCAFGDDDAVIEDFFATAYAPERCRFLQEGTQITAALYWLDTQYAGRTYAYIYGVATHPEYRGRGLCKKLMALTQEQLRQSGYAGALLVPGEEGLRRMYVGMGYQTCSTLSQFSCKAGETAVAVRSVSREEYAALRRTYLPRGGVIQEGENLAYLQTYGQLLAGDTFVLAGMALEEGTFLGLELLGDSTQAPSILKALGYGQGTFRIPGDGFPFAMYRGLQEDAPIPTYFGLAFDE